MQQRQAAPEIRRRAVLLAAFFVCGPGLRLFLPAQEPAPAAAPPPPHRLRVCSYNLKNWLSMPRGAGANLPPTGKPEKEKQKIVGFLTAISPQVLGVCEIGGEEDLNDLKERLEKARLRFPYVVNAHGGDPTRRLGLLSQFPVVAENSQTSLSYQLGEQTLAVKRGFLDATLQVTPGFQLHLVGVHLKSKREDTEGDQALMRRNEAHLLRQHLDQLLTAAPLDNLAVYGDFNEDPKEPAIEEIIGNRATSPLLLHEVRLVDAHDQLWTHFWDLHDLYSRIDYFFLSPALRPHVKDSDCFIFTALDFDKGSDHRPIVLNIDLDEPKRRRRK